MAEVSVKKSKKVWVKIVGSKEFKNNELGESYTSNPKGLVGKRVNANLSGLIEDMRKQNTIIGFRIKEVNGNQANAEMDSYRLVSAHIRRIVRSGKDKIESSFVIDSKDGKKVRIKPLILTRAKTKNSVLTAIGKKINDYFIEFGKENSFDDIIKKTISGELIKSLRNDIKKIYPLSALELKVIEVVE
ncbi:MAG: hypothetical protein AABW46_00090 [Nanoarchaeota archaeon]